MSTTINLTAGESKLLNAVIEEMKDMPEVDFEAVAQKVGIKYAKNARQSFRRVWDKMKGGAATANGNGTHAEDTNDGLEVDSPKKPAAKKAAAPKKAPAKKAVAKTTVPKKASEGGPKTKAPRKTKKQKDEEEDVPAAAAEAEEHEDNEDEDKDVAEDNENGKSLTPKGAISAIKPDEVVAESAVSVLDDPYVMDDEYEARLRDMPLETWLKWKSESGYTFDLLSL